MVDEDNPPVVLCEAGLARLRDRMRVPAYDRRQVTPSLVHIGVGGFFRAHQAVYLDELLESGDHGAWGYLGLGLLARDAGMRDALSPQDGLYTLVERSAAGDRPRIVGSLLDFRLAPEDREGALEVLAAPECRIVSLTITEGGYYVSEATGGFDEGHPDVVHDRAHPQAPRCTFGYLVEALARRQARGLAPFTVMSCDNVQHNGDIARRTVLAFAEGRAPALGRWIAEHVAFPNSMVDRITPATTDEHRRLVRERFGVVDAWPVMTEPFMQWVLEDRFPGGRPAWERVGVQLTGDVAPYEKMKMRLLNASHQAMCYIGMLLGHEFAHETMADARIRRLVERMMDEEVTPLLVEPEGIDLEAYKRTLIERFANPAVRDQLSRIGTEGSARIPGFVLPSIAEQLERGGPCRLLAFTVACWLRSLTGKDDEGRELPVIDPLRERLMACAASAGADAAPLLAIEEVFGRQLPAVERFAREVGEGLRALHERGSAAALEAYVA